MRCLRAGISRRKKIPSDLSDRSGGRINSEQHSRVQKEEEVSVEKSDLLIGGQICSPTSGRYYPLYSPVDGELVAEVADASRAAAAAREVVDDLLLPHGHARALGGTTGVGVATAVVAEHKAGGRAIHDRPYRSHSSNSSAEPLQRFGTNEISSEMTRRWLRIGSQPYPNGVRLRVVSRSTPT